MEISESMIFIYFYGYIRPLPLGAGAKKNGKVNRKKRRDATAKKRRH